MLVRFVAENVFSFGERKEFNMIANSRLKSQLHHKHPMHGIDLLKQTAVYGANAAGKSNLIKALGMLLDLAKKTVNASAVARSKFKFAQNNEQQLLAVEFVEQGKPFYYAVLLRSGMIVTEELYHSGLGAKQDRLIFERNTTPGHITTLKFNEQLEKDPKSEIIKEVLIDEFILPDQTAFQLLSHRGHEGFQDLKLAYEWFENSVTIIKPQTRPLLLTQVVEENEELKLFIEKVASIIGLGTASLKILKRPLSELKGGMQLGEADYIHDRLNALYEKNEKALPVGLSNVTDRILFVKENEEVWAKQLLVVHRNGHGQEVDFELKDESDGTNRLFDIILAFYSLIKLPVVVLIDEVEHSIHPLLIKKLLQKFSDDGAIKGQLIFTTHESVLLDQGLFRQDEIWFAEKDQGGNTDLYSLSDFKEHKTIDIRKGYLNGRYGGIPFVGDLNELNWHQYDIEEQAV